MFFVRARVAGPWRTVDVNDIHGLKVAERYLVMATVAGPWCVNSEGVDVEPGLVVGFRDGSDADWFLQQRRAQMVSVEPDAVVCFHAESDAEFFVRQGLAERMSDREVQVFFAELRGETLAEEPPAPEPVNIPPPAPTKRGRKPKSKG